MTRSRSLPTDLFDDPDFFDLSSSTQVILLGLVLFADDYGRGLAHSGLLARKCNKEQALVEQALGELQAADLLLCYPGEHYSYYALTRWTRWETLSKPALSRYPAPPTLRCTTIGSFWSISVCEHGCHARLDCEPRKESRGGRMTGAKQGWHASCDGSMWQAEQAMECVVKGDHHE